MDPAQAVALPFAHDDASTAESTDPFDPVLRNHSIGGPLLFKRLLKWPSLVYPFRAMGSLRPIEAAAAAADRRQVDRVILGDASALRAIYDRCSGRAFAIALKILGTRPDAEEVLQETFLEVWKRAREYDPRRGGIEGWVVTIA